MTRLVIVTDMEGIIGIERYEQCASTHPDYRSGVELLCEEVNVIADEALSFGVESVSVVDLHGGGGNIDPELLDSRVQVIPEDLSDGFDLAFLVGFHAMAGEQTRFITHTMTQGLMLEVGGRPVGEIALWSWWVGEHGIPVGLIVGDRAGTAEAERFVPEVPTLAVKQAETWGRATVVPVQQAYEALKARVRYALEQPGRQHVYRPEQPVRFRLRLRDESPTVNLIPWLEEQEDGWLSGEVSTGRELIDPIDVVSALMSDQARGHMIEQLTRDPAARSQIDQIRADRIAESIERNPWVID